MDYSESDVKVYIKATNLLPAESTRAQIKLLPAESTSNADKKKLPEPVPVEVKPVSFDPDSLYYDMSGVKQMFIFNQSEYERNYIYGDDPPEPRKKGTTEDVDAVNTLFTSLGFKVFPHENKRFMEIKTILTDVCKQDHSGTSCLAVVIMTHGFKDGVLCAYDRPYLLSEILAIFEKAHISLVHKPKLFFIQATEVDSSLHELFDNILPSEPDNSEAPEPIEQQGSSEEACRGDLVDAGRMTHHDGLGKKSLHVSTHVEFLIARSTVENYRAWRESWGSWFLHELCLVIKANHETMDLLQMLTLVTRRVAYKYKSTTFERELDKKKETPETRTTLTKLLKF